ncbi:glyoxalase superfamily protein [Aeromonas caviae]|uniref:Glyoxalase superfamily protein n=1 Tax=Aeromonas caviae TaxID=648 RepID=A0AAJ6CTR1_AERCA|nr:glyoxalase superfamily protein [Aeromonas caviae]WFG00131.1 glyoxalase superfamily protein [Aeromonas caviae]
MSDAIKTAKLQADKMSARLKQLGVVIKRTQCLEAIAAINNYPDWNRFSAALASGAASPVVTGVSQQMSERYIVGDMADISCSEYARKVFCAALRAGHQPIYVELISGRSRPFPPPAGAAVSKLDVLFDWEGDIRSTHDVISNLSKNENLFSDPALAEKLFPSPLHIALGL